jgi:hypothetical protein
LNGFVTRLRVSEEGELPLAKKDWQSFAGSIKNAVSLALTPFDR